MNIFSPVLEGDKNLAATTPQKSYSIVLVLRLSGLNQLCLVYLYPKYTLHSHRLGKLLNRSCIVGLSQIDKSIQFDYFHSLNHSHRFSFSFHLFEAVEILRQVFVIVIAAIQALFLFRFNRIHYFQMKLDSHSLLTRQYDWLHSLPS